MEYATVVSALAVSVTTVFFALGKMGLFSKSWDPRGKVSASECAVRQEHD